MTDTTGLVTDSAETLAEELAEHEFVGASREDTYGNEIERVGCLCGQWEWDANDEACYERWNAHVAQTLIASGAVRPAAEVRAEAWDEGFASGTSRAMRYMSDEPSLSLDVPNPYRAALAGEQAEDRAQALREAADAPFSVAPVPVVSPTGLPGYVHHPIPRRTS